MMDMTRAPQADIFNFLDLLTQRFDDAAFEIRALNAGYMHRQVVSGYYNRSSLDLAVEAAASLNRKCGGVYVTLNPVDPALLGRANQRLIERPKETTADANILRRHWLPVDFDPRRPSGISSTEMEHAAAIARADECQTWLRTQGWSDPLFGDSGNGAHLLYPVDEPNTEETRTLFANVLKSLALRFSDDQVEVDLTTFNAARIFKCYGTLAAKGDDMPDRPHRMSHVISVQP